MPTVNAAAASATSWGQVAIGPHENAAATEPRQSAALVAVSVKPCPKPVENPVSYRRAVPHTLQRRVLR